MTSFQEIYHYSQHNSIKKPCFRLQFTSNTVTKCQISASLINKLILGIFPQITAVEVAILLRKFSSYTSQHFSYSRVCIITSLGPLRILEVWNFGALEFWGFCAYREPTAGYVYSEYKNLYDNITSIHIQVIWQGNQCKKIKVILKSYFKRGSVCEVRKCAPDSLSQRS